MSTQPTKTAEDVRRVVQDSYGGRVGCCSQKKSCCSQPLVPSAQTNRAATQMGYSEDDLKAVPEESNLGLGCGAPLKAAGLKQGEVVLDLGSGAGFDAFLAAKEVGPTGKVIGVDMTPEMVAKAKQNAVKRQERAGDQPLCPVEFREGLIEQLPIASDTIDVIISNCVINLSPEKDKVFAEAFRVLKRGGRLCFSDIVLTAPLPEVIRSSLSAYVGCIAGASLQQDYVNALYKAGFSDVEMTTKHAFDVLSCDDPIVQHMLEEAQGKVDLDQVKMTIVSATIVATKKR